MKKALVVFILALTVLVGAITWEYIFERQNRENWVERFQVRLQQQEKKADEWLMLLEDTVNVKQQEWEEDIILIGFHNNKIFFWTDEIIGIEGLYELLEMGDPFVKVNNTYYDVRKRSYGDTLYFALLPIKDNYPYSNKYIKNRFGKFLGVGIENTDNIDVSRFPEEGSMAIKNCDGQTLCYINHNENYKDRSVNYILLFFYLLSFVSFFYVFDLLLASAPSLRLQLFYIGAFGVFLICLRYFMLSCRVPDTLYRLSVFDNNMAEGSLVASIGDLLMSAFSIVQLLYISFANLKIHYASPRVIRWRYAIAIGMITWAFVYMLFINYALKSLINNTEIYLNIAQLVDIDFSFVLAFVGIIMGGLGLILIVDGTVAICKNLIPFRKMLFMITGMMGGVALLAGLTDYYVTCWGCIFVWGVFMLTALSKYILKRDIQRSIYMLTMFLLSVYIVLIAKNYERYRELTQRAEYATELIEERDYNFEKKLLEISIQINDSEVIADLVANYNEEFLKMCLANDLLDLNGYNYRSDITLCQSRDSIWVGEELKECNDYFDELIVRYGEVVGNSGFYSIVNFDGIVSYIGKFVFGEVTLFLRFDSTKDSEGSGYPQILSRKSIEGENTIYPYSYAKYKNGQLIASSGDFIYYKTLDRFANYDGNMEIVEQDNYSHMLIPVDKEGVLVVSFHRSLFSLYYMNVLYAFFICIILSSYGVFFRVNHNVSFRKGTLKARIKSSVVSLIFILFVILTALSIYLNRKSFENRHNAKATELLKYINKELEQRECVEYRECPQIQDVLAELSEILMVDINIYSEQGMLVATSRPEIFSAGFDGYLINAEALEKVGREGAMSYVGQEHIGELKYMSAYMPLIPENGKFYILNVPYFTQNRELNVDIIVMVIIAVNIAVVVMVLAFILSGVVAERVTKPLQLVNDKLKAMRVDRINEKIDYNYRDEVGELVREYNNMVEKLEESVNQLARSERESAWREMARQIAHEIKNPLTPMKLNIQFMQRSLQIENPEKFKERFKNISAILIEQIENMASIASAFSDFARISVSQNERFNISEMALNCAFLFEKNIDHLECEVEPDIFVFADKEQIRRVFVNVLKNAVQSIPEEREGNIVLRLKRKQGKVVISIRDNGTGIPEELKDKVFEPNFTTKTSGTGLGLAISRRIIESMGGTINFQRLEQGTEFFIILEGVE